MNEINHFCFGDFCSADHNIILTAQPQEVFAERDVETVSIAGRSGDLIRDNGRYKNVTVSFDCAIIPDDTCNMREALIAAIDQLNPTADYRRLTSTYAPGYFRMARVTSGISVSSIVEQAGTFKLAFDCKPQRFLEAQENETLLVEATDFWNPCGQPSKPLITVYGTGPGTLTIGNTTVEIKYMDDQITLDCDLMTAYRKVGDAPAENKNSDIHAPEFPELAPGANRISWDGGIERIAVIPRGWTL